MKKTIIIIAITIFLITLAGTLALTYTSLSGGRYNVTFSSGHQVIVESITYDAKTKNMTIIINDTVDKTPGMTIKDLNEAREYGMTVNGRSKSYEKTIFIKK